MTPLSLLQRAARLPGRALALYLAVRHRADLTRGQAVTLPTAYLRDWGIDRHAKARGLAALENAGLVTVERRPGRSVGVTVTHDGAT